MFSIRNKTNSDINKEIFNINKEIINRETVIKNKNKKELTQNDKKKKRENQVIINDLIMNWQNTFGNLKHWNQEKNGYTLSHIEVEDYGCSARLYAPWGMDLHDLEKYTSIIETGCKCEFLYNIPQHRQFAMVKFIFPNQVKINSWEFNPIKVKPWEFCAGYDVSGEPVIFNLNDTPQILDAGQQRRGKNGAIDHALVSWIYSCSEKEITFYLFQCAKNDLIKYKDCKQVYCYADTLEKIEIALEHIEKELHRRTKLFENMVSKADGNDNIFHYNNLHKNNKLPYIIVVIDEFIELMPDNTIDGKEIKETKNKIMKYLRQIGQWGGSLGINYAILHQKPSRELIPIFIKNQSSIRICFGFEDLVCCAIVLGDELAKYAHKLPPRKAYFSNNEQNGYLYTSNLKGRIRMFIEPSIDTNHRTLFSDLEKLNKVDIKAIQPPEDNTDENIIEQTQKGTAPLPKKATPIKKEEIKNISKDKPVTKGIEIIKPIEKTIETTENLSKPKIEIPKIKIVEPMLINTPLEFNNVDPIKVVIDEQKLIDNIKNIPDFVPYNPNFKPKIIIDQTKLNLNTQKSVKKSKGDSE